MGCARNRTEPEVELLSSTRWGRGPGLVIESCLARRASGKPEFREQSRLQLAVLSFDAMGSAVGQCGCSDPGLEHGPGLRRVSPVDQKTQALFAETWIRAVS